MGPSHLCLSPALKLGCSRLQLFQIWFIRKTLWDVTSWELFTSLRIYTFLCDLGRHFTPAYINFTLFCESKRMTEGSLIARRCWLSKSTKLVSGTMAGAAGDSMKWGWEGESRSQAPVFLVMWTPLSFYWDPKGSDSYLNLPIQFFAQSNSG